MSNFETIYIEMFWSLLKVHTKCRFGEGSCIGDETWDGRNLCCRIQILREPFLTLGNMFGCVDVDGVG